MLQSALTSQSCDPSAHSSASVKQRIISLKKDLWTKIFHDVPKGLTESLRLSPEVCRTCDDAVLITLISLFSSTGFLIEMIKTRFFVHLC